MKVNKKLTWRGNTVFHAGINGAGNVGQFMVHIELFFIVT